MCYNVYNFIHSNGEFWAFKYELTEDLLTFTGHRLSWSHHSLMRNTVSRAAYFVLGLHYIIWRYSPETPPHHSSSLDTVTGCTRCVLSVSLSLTREFAYDNKNGNQYFAFPLNLCSHPLTLQCTASSFCDSWPSDTALACQSTHQLSKSTEPERGLKHRLIFEDPVGLRAEFHGTVLVCLPVEAALHQLSALLRWILLSA